MITEHLFFDEFEDWSAKIIEIGGKKSDQGKGFWYAKDEQGESCGYFSMDTHYGTLRITS